MEDHIDPLVPPPANDAALEEERASNRRLHAVAKKLKALLDTTQEELKSSQARVSELELAARASSTKSVLSTLLGVPAAEAEGVEARIAARVPVVEPGGETRVWCCITAPDGSRADWILEDDLLTRVPRFSHPVRQCELHTTPMEAAGLRARVAEPVEELRKYRVRAEALLRQRDAELAASKERSANNIEGVQGVGGDGAGSYLSMSTSTSGETTEGLLRRLGEAHSQAQRLLAARGDLLERERAAKEAEEEACREAALARKEATLWQSKWAEAVGAGFSTASPGLASAATSSIAVISGTGGDAEGTHHSLTSTPSFSSSATLAAAVAEARAPLQVELAKTQGEYLAYRRRAVAMIKEKDDQMKRLAEDMSSVKARLAEAVASAAMATTTTTGQVQNSASFNSSPAGGGVDFSSPLSLSSGVHRAGTVPISPSHTPDLSRWLYLRALLLKYLGEADSSIRLSLEPALFTVLGLSPTDVSQIHRCRGTGTPVFENLSSVGLSAVSDTLNGLWSLLGTAGAGGGAPSSALGFGASSPMPPPQTPPQQQIPHVDYALQLLQTEKD